MMVEYWWTNHDSHFSCCLPSCNPKKRPEHGRFLVFLLNQWWKCTEWVSLFLSNHMLSLGACTGYRQRAAVDPMMGTSSLKGLVTLLNSRGVWSATLAGRRGGLCSQGQNYSGIVQNHCLSPVQTLSSIAACFLASGVWLLTSVSR